MATEPSRKQTRAAAPAATPVRVATAGFRDRWGSAPDPGEAPAPPGRRRETAPPWRGAPGRSPRADAARSEPASRSPGAGRDQGHRRHLGPAPAGSCGGLRSGAPPTAGSASAGRPSPRPRRPGQRRPRPRAAPPRRPPPPRPPRRGRGRTEGRRGLARGEPARPVLAPGGPASSGLAGCSGRSSWSKPNSKGRSRPRSGPRPAIRSVSSTGAWSSTKKERRRSPSSQSSAPWRQVGPRTGADSPSPAPVA